MKAADWDARYAEHQMRHDRDGTLWGVEPNRFVARDLAGLPPGRALDLACGEGRNAIWLAERGWQVTAVDFSSVAIDRGRELAEHRGVTVDFVVADLLSWVPEPEHYDLVVLAYLQLPDDERRAVFGRAARAVAAGGTLYVLAHDSRNLRDGIGGPQEPAVLYTAGDVAADLPDFDIVRAGEELRPVDGGTAIDCLVVARRPGPPATAAS
ncbi:MAG TPA: class I SAM-dependent methyltransferase [Acidimicrobiia bacterium]|nr:class I SAM-dependent methyltransferase [Acidimicrobiia bacterium]